MPPSAKLQQYAILDRVARAVGVWPIEAYEFVHLGLAHTVNSLYGSKSPRPGPRSPATSPARNYAGACATMRTSGGACLPCPS